MSVAQSIAMKTRGAAHKAAGDDKDHVNAAAAEIDYEPLRAELEPELRAIAQDAARLGLDQVDVDLEEMLSQANAEAITWSEQHAGELVKGLDETTRALVKTLTTEALEAGWSNDELAAELETSDAFDDARSERIARTETAFADVQGNLIGWEASGVVEGKEWIVGDGCCDECQALNGEVVALDEEFSDGSDGPPAHPLCRCDVLPVVKEDDE